MAKLKPPDELPSKAWLMSFGDTMTTLLAFFIVLVSLAEDQTGANLHAGTGSFVETLASGGTAGIFPGNKSKRSVQLEATSPLYHTDEDANADDDSDVPSKDREHESFSRFINEMERLSSVEVGKTTTGETIFDFFQKFSEKPPHLPENFQQIATRVFPVLRRANYRVEIIAWAPTPSASALSRSSSRAASLREQIIKQFELTPDASQRILGTTRTWPHANERRPVVSVAIRRNKE